VVWYKDNKKSNIPNPNMHWLYLNVRTLLCYLASVTFLLTLDFCYKYTNMYVALKKFGNMYTKVKNISHIPKFNIIQLWNLTVANWLKLIYKDYLPWIQSKTSTMSHRPVIFISYGCSIKFQKYFPSFINKVFIVLYHRT